MMAKTRQQLQDELDAALAQNESLQDQLDQVADIVAPSDDDEEEDYDDQDDDQDEE